MPLGFNCEYRDFDTCVRQNRDKNSPRRYCGWLKKMTEEKCKGKDGITGLNDAMRGVLG